MKKLMIIPILLLALLLIPVTASAASGVYVVDKAGDGNWTDDIWWVSIYPGETKSTNLTLRNPSSSSLAVWVNVTPSPFANDNLTFGLSETNFTMSGGSTKKVILSVIANGSATPGNYTAKLELKSEVPTPGKGPGPGGGGEKCYLKIDILGEITKIRVSCSTDRTYADVVASGPDNIHSLEIDSYTKVLCENTNEAPAGLVVSLVEEPPSVPNGSVLIGSAYNFTGNYRTSSCGQPKHQCSGITFSKNITLKLGYDFLPEGVGDLAIFYYDNDDWVKLISIVENNTVATSIDHIAFPTFAIIGVIAPLAPLFSVSNLSITPQEVAPDETVTVAVEVSNAGEVGGNYTVVLKVNGVEEADRTVSVDSGGSKVVSFSVAREDTGAYGVSVDGLAGSFTVVPPPGFNVWLIIAPIIAVITAVAAFLFVRQWRRYEYE